MSRPILASVALRTVDTDILDEFGPAAQRAPPAQQHFLWVDGAFAARVGGVGLIPIIPLRFVKLRRLAHVLAETAEARRSAALVAVSVAASVVLRLLELHTHAAGAGRLLRGMTMQLVWPYQLQCRTQRA